MAAKPHRTVDLGLIVPRGDEFIPMRQALWFTDEVMNILGGDFEYLCLEFRQEDVCIGIDDDEKDIMVPAAVWQERLIKRLLARGVDIGTIKFALPKLKEVWELLSTGDAGKTANAWGNALTSKVSEGGMGLEAFVGAFAGLPLPAFVWKWKRTPKGEEPPPEKLNETNSTKLYQPPPEWIAQAEALLLADRRLLTPTGRRPPWMDDFILDRPKLAREIYGETIEKVDGRLKDRAGLHAKLLAAGVVPYHWSVGLASDLERKRASSGDNNLRLILRKLGVFPILTTPLESMGRSAGVWVRTALAQAISATKAWEKAAENTAAEKLSRRAACDAWDKRNAERLASQIVKVRAWEKAYNAAQAALHEEEGDGLWQPDSYRYLLPKHLRCWGDMRKWLTANTKDDQSPPYEERLKFLEKLAKVSGRKFGDINVQKWLILDEHRDLWGCVHAIAQRNYMEILAVRARSHAIRTVSDARKHHSR